MANRIPKALAVVVSSTTPLESANRFAGTRPEPNHTTTQRNLCLGQSYAIYSLGVVASGLEVEGRVRKPMRVANSRCEPIREPPSLFHGVTMIHICRNISKSMSFIWPRSHMGVESAQVREGRHITDRRWTCLANFAACAMTHITHTTINQHQCCLPCPSPNCLVTPYTTLRPPNQQASTLPLLTPGTFLRFLSDILLQS